MNGEPTPWVENRARDRRIPMLGLGDFWTSRELAFLFAVRDVKVRYKQAILGFAGMLLQPVIGALAFTFLFNGLGDIQTEGSYFAFAITGFVIWTFITATSGRVANSLLDHEDLISYVKFPFVAAPVAGLLVACIDLAISTVVAGALALLAGARMSLVGLLVGMPAAIALGSVFAVGTGLIFAPLFVKYRDTSAVLGIGFQVMFFVAPIAYPPELVGEPWRQLQYLNPVTGALSLFRWAMIDAPPPSLVELAMSVAVAMVIAPVGLITFRRNEQTLVDVI